MLEVRGKLNEGQRNGRAGAEAPSYQASSQTVADYELKKSLPGNQETLPVPAILPVPKSSTSSRTRLPVIIGEIHYTGTLPIDGVVVGQLGNNGGSLGVRQKSSSVFSSQPELSGQINFRDMVRVNGHIAGSVYSKSGTLIVDSSATVDANVEVAVAVIGGTVRGDIVAHERIELGPAAKIYGNIWTRSIAIKDGAFFDGVCTMIGGSHPSD